MDNQRGLGRGAFGDETPYEVQWEYRYVSGALAMRMSGPIPHRAGSFPYEAVPAADRILGDFAVEVRARSTASSGRARYGIDYVVAGTDRYRLEVAPAVQHYGISLGPLSRNFMASGRSSVVSGGDAENHLRMEVRGRTMAAFVNGVAMERGEHDGLSRRGGTIELVMGLFGLPDDSVVEVQFTDFKLYSLEP